MADPKYANLFGIAYDQPDVYETDDLPECEQNTNIYEENGDVNVEILHLSVPDAFSKFKEKSLESSKVDFSDRLSRNKRTGYYAMSGDWELAGSEEKETVVQKYQRLCCEMKELMEEISTIKNTAKEEAETGSAPYTNFVEQLEFMSKQMSSLNLQESIGTELCDFKQFNVDQVKKLLTQLDQIKSTEKTAVEKTKEEKGKSASDGKDSAIKYQLTISPGQAALAQTTRIADLEQRLNRLEAAIGSSSGKLTRLGNGERSLMETAQYLSAKVALLDSTVLDAAELRIGSLVSKLDQVMEKSAAVAGSSQDEEKNKRINKLYDLLKETTDISKVLPQTLERLNALQQLHLKSNEFSKTLGELEESQARIDATAELNTEVLKQMKEGFESNLEAIKANIESLDKRIKQLTTKNK